MAMIVIVVGALIASADRSPATAAVLSDGPAAWADLAAFLSQLPGITPGSLSALGLADPSPGTASGPTGVA